VRAAWRLLPLALLLPHPAAAQTLREQAWLPPGSAIATSLARQPAEEAGTDTEIALGRLLFRSPDILGGNARRAGLSCNACHPAGHRNERFFMPGLSSAPGNVDVSHAFWNLANDNGIADPLPIPSLRGAGAKTVFGQDRRTLEAFIDHVIQTEFAGAARPDVVAALAAYVRDLKPTGAADRAVTPHTDMEEARQGAHVVADLAERENTLTALAAAAVRGHLGRMAERFNRPEHRPAVQQIGFWAADLRRIEREAEDGNHAAAARDAANLARNLVAGPLVGAVAGSFYDSNEIERVFGP
jgi:hypothetical protein